MLEAESNTKNVALADKKMLLVGAPRTGFALLLNILGALGRPPYSADTNHQRAVNLLSRPAGEFLYQNIIGFFKNRFDEKDIIYNQTFRPLLGGPKWIAQDNPKQICVRKYVGIKDVGDFSLIINLPKHMLHFYDRIHSHYYPQQWLAEPMFKDLIRFASIRNPLGTIYSSAFSINAITGEYINRFIGNEDDLRTKFAMFRLSDLEMVKGLAQHLAKYLEEFRSVEEKYNLFRWEDIIQSPTETIQNIAACRGIEITSHEANDIWQKIAYTNLTGKHQYNFRANKEKGRVDDWKHYLLNEHMDIIRAAGLDEQMKHFGYGEISQFDENNYSDFQVSVKHAINSGKVITAGLEDKNLRVFNWNKSNITKTSHSFTHHKRNDYSQIERAAFDDTNLLDEFESFIDARSGEINHFIENCFTRLMHTTTNNWSNTLAELKKQHGDLFYNMNTPELSQEFDRTFEFIHENIK